MRALIRRTKELDPTRLVTFVTAPGSVRDHRAYEDADLVATNMYYGSLTAPLAEHRDQLERGLASPRRSICARARRFPGQAVLDHRVRRDGHARAARRCSVDGRLPGRYIRAVWAAISGVPDVSGGVLWSWADYHHRRHFQANGAFGAFGAVTIDRKPKAALATLAAIYGGGSLSERRSAANPSQSDLSSSPYASTSGQPARFSARHGIQKNPKSLIFAPEIRKPVVENSKPGTDSLGNALVPTRTRAPRSCSEQARS